MVLPKAFSYSADAQGCWLTLDCCWQEDAERTST